MPYPPPLIRHFFRCSSVAFISLGYQASGTVMVRPSDRLTLNSESVILTSFTRSSAPRVQLPSDGEDGVEIGMDGCHKLRQFGDGRSGAGLFVAGVGVNRRRTHPPGGLLQCHSVFLTLSAQQ